MKWFMRVATASVLVDTLMEIDPCFPKVTKRQRRALQDVRQALEAQAPKGAAADSFEQRQHQHDGQAQTGKLIARRQAA